MLSFSQNTTRRRRHNEHSGFRILLRRDGCGSGAGRTAAAVRRDSLPGGHARPVRRRGAGDRLPQARAGHRRPIRQGAGRRGPDEARHRRRGGNVCPGAYRRGAGGGVLRQIRCLRAGGAADPRTPCAGPHRCQLSGVSGAGTALRGTGHLRRQHPDRGRAGLHGYDGAGRHPRRRGGGVLRQGGPCAGTALPRRQAHGRAGAAVRRRQI